MTSIYQRMYHDALALFDEMVEQRAGEIRSSMQAAGCTRAQIRAYLAACRPNLDEQRRGVGAMVKAALVAQGVSLEMSVDVLD